MKLRYYLILPLIILFTASLFAQEDVLRPKGKPEGYEKESRERRKGRFTLGIEAGANFNFFSQTLNAYTQDLYMDKGFGISPLFGILVDFSLSDKMGIQLKSDFDIKLVAGRENDPFGVKIDRTVTTGYITLTPLFRFNFTPAFFMTVGPTFHFLVGNNAQDPYHYTYYTTSYTNDTRVGIDFGIGYKIRLSRVFLLVPQGRFQFMFTPAFKNLSDVVETGLDDITDRNLHSAQLVLGFWWEL